MTSQTQFATLFEQHANKLQLRPGVILEATIVEIDPLENGYVTVNAGLKSDSYIPKAEFRDENGGYLIQVGDAVKVVLVEFDEGGQTILSRDLAKRSETWDKLEKIYDSKETVTGIVTGRVNRGYTVEVGNVRAFLPNSLIDVRALRETGPIDGKALEFKIIKLDRKRNNIVLSRRAVTEEVNPERAQVLENIQEGKVLKGVVKNLTDYGAFIDLGGLDGLLHKTDIAWRRINNPNEVLKIGEEINVIVLKLDRERNRVSLGMKQLDDDPWHGLAKEFPKNSKVKGIVTNVTDYGCFVEIKSGVEGLVHQSEMDWTNKNVAPSRIVQEGQEVEVMILDIDEERRRISLGIKQCVANPWEAFVAKHNKGEKISGVIKSITDFGIFVGLEGEIDGLVHASDIAWTVAPEVAIRDFKKGQEVTAVILAMDAERERISLGIKQLEEDVFSSFVEAHPKGSTVKGKVIEVDAKAATIELAPGINAIMRAAEISREKVEDARQVLKVDEEIEARIINIDRKTRSISLSVKAQELHAEAQATREYSKKQEGSNATLGDLMKEQMGTQTREENSES